MCLTINLPPLRERPGDVRLLIEHFVGPDWNLEPTVIPTLERYSWPGNIRQLQNAIERAKILAHDDWVRIENLPARDCARRAEFCGAVGGCQM